ncbi:MAG: RHS repeat-associated core domain-containing protein, partial [Candidatus Electrothrix sp. AW5]|nr:RHS repeat-associated core domain-containing protein [Candidatus Electrothrix gigas]
GGLLELRQGGQHYAYLYDGKGNVDGLIDDAEAMVAGYVYTPFGRLLTKTGSLDQPFRFSTKAFDEQNGLAYYGYRFYSPGVGRWINRDPIGEAGGINLYGFVGNGPVNWIDPNGLSPLKIISLCTKGYKIVKTVGWKEAVRAVRKGENVLAGSRAEAKRLARSASKKKNPIRDPAHKPKEGQMRHYHPNPRNGSHVFYQIAAGLTFSNYMQCENPEKMCKKSVAGQVLDLFNPLSIGQDAIDIFE